LKQVDKGEPVGTPNWSKWREYIVSIMDQTLMTSIPLS